MSISNQPVIDLDRLHEATEKILNCSYRYRGEGITFAYLHLMLGEWELGDERNKYLYIGDNRTIARQVAAHFKHLRTPGRGNPIFLFCGVGEDERKSAICGTEFTRIYLDISEERWRTLKAEGKIFDLHVDLISHLAPSGDII